MGKVFALALTAALNPTLLAATTVMLTLERPKRLLGGYWVGALLTSFTCGMVLVFALGSSSTSDTAQHKISPAIDLTLGALLLVVAYVVGTGRDRRRREWSARRKEKAKDKPPPRWKRQLSKGSARDTFVIGILLSFPGASYIAGMDRLSKQNLSVPLTVLSVIAFNLIMLALLEIPLIGFTVRPDETTTTVGRFNDWLTRRGGHVALIATVVIAVLLILKGLLSL